MSVCNERKGVSGATAVSPLRQVEGKMSTDKNMMKSDTDILSAYTVRHSVQVPKSVEETFGLFVDTLDEWWPAAYTWSQDVLQEMVIEPEVNGRCYERGPHGFTCDWGRVLIWQPPHHLQFTWQISPRREPVPNPAKASEVDIHFEADGPNQTQVVLEHRHFDRHGEGSEKYQEMMDSPQGWPYILRQFETAVS